MKKAIPFLFVFTAIVVIESCRKDNYQEVCYGKDLQPVFTRSCTNVGCHSAGSRAGGYSFTTYDGVITAVKPGNAKGSPLYKAIKGSHPAMPKTGDPLSKKEVSMIK